MSMSRQSLVDRAYLKNQSGPAANVPYARYDSLVNQAMSLLADKVSNSPDERVRNQLKKDFTLAVSSGAAALAAAQTASEPLLDNALDKATITSADSSYPWQYLPTYEELSLERPVFGLIFFSVKNGNLVCTDTSGALGTLSTTATASCAFIPLPSTLSGNLNLEEAAIETLAGLAAMGQSQAA